MNTSISHDNYLNMNVYVIENDKLIVKVLKDFGAKILSIYHKETDYELLFQTTKNEYKIPKLGDSFEEYDTSGVDEMLPTIDPCFYPNSYVKLNDHGDVWAQKWENDINDNTLISKVRSDTLKLDLHRSITLEDDEIILSYKLKNLTEQDHYYLWAFHGLLNFNDKTELEFPTNGEIINVLDSTTYDFDYKKLSEYPDKNSYKFYFVDEIDNGEVKIFQRDKNLEIKYNFSTDINKYLGVWVTKGGFKGEYNFAIEPSSGFYDSLERAFLNKKASKIDSKDEKNWELKIKVSKGEING